MQSKQQSNRWTPAGRHLCRGCNADINGLLALERRLDFCCEECALTWANERQGMASNRLIDDFLGQAKRLLISALTTGDEELHLIRLLAVGVKLYPEVASAAKNALAAVERRRSLAGAGHAPDSPPVECQHRIEMVQAVAENGAQKPEEPGPEDALTSFP